MQKSSFIFIGRSGSGKGTQAKLLIDFLKNTAKEPVLYFEIGQKFRNFVEQDSYSAKLAKAISDVSGLQPDFLTIWLISQAMIEKVKGDENVVIDGSPRSLKQAKVIDGVLDFYGFDKKFVIYLNVTEEESVSRLKQRGRSDDVSEERVKNKQSWFEEFIVPAIDFYRDNEKYEFIEVDGTKTISEISEVIKNRYSKAKQEK